VTSQGQHRGTGSFTRWRLGAYSDAEWDRGPAGPHLIEDRRCGKLLGGTQLQARVYLGSFRAVQLQQFVVEAKN
jgi:hypothetical protein